MFHTKFNPHSRNSDITFHSVQIDHKADPPTKEGSATYLGVAKAIGSLEGWLDTPMYFRIFRTPHGLVLGHRCGVLHTFTTRQQSAEVLYCYNCWNQIHVHLTHMYYFFDSKENSDPFSRISPCLCGKAFQTWEQGEPLLEGKTYLFTSFKSKPLEDSVAELLNQKSETASTASK